MDPSRYKRNDFYQDMARQEERLAGGHGGLARFDSHGRDMHRPEYARRHPPSQFQSRVRRVKDALWDSEAIALRQVAQDLGGIDIAAVWPILGNMCHDIALYLGGSTAAGGVVGAGIGFFLGGAGAVPGALAGTAAGAQIGGILLAFMGLKSLAEYMADSIPRAARCYARGFEWAWGALPDRHGHGGGICQGGDYFAARDFAEGHVIVVMALLMAVTAYLTRGKGDLGALLAEVRQSARMGPKMADWLAQNADRLRNNPRLQGPMASVKAGGGDAAAKDAAAGTAKKPAPHNKPSEAETPIGEQSTAKKGIFGEAKGDEYMHGRDFEKLNNGGRLTKVGDDPAGKGLDGVWKNAHPPPDYVITETKFGAGRLGQTRDGLQMGDDWVNGTNTGFDRLKKAVGPKKATEIFDAMNEGRIEKWLLKVDESGNVTKTVLNALGKAE